MNRGSLMIMVYSNFSESLRDNVTSIFEQSEGFRILVSDGIILDYAFTEKLRRMNGFIQRILTSHQIVRIMGDGSNMDSCMIIRSSILDDWGKENSDYFLDTLPLWPGQNGTKVFLFLVGAPSPLVRMNHTMGIAFYADKQGGEKLQWGETARRQGRLLSRWEK
ncbi:MAG: hypothetical protein M1375_03860 [Candidatus Thermoplasmatota archaeon]|jgi:hypothetical protein|nr:hypothetical protein [Candidatus Thermoplasmatota archaeon]MCL5791089.1 hypothetical protein [Candidatus Thermoplasmatota archaeon]